MRATTACVIRLRTADERVRRLVTDGDGGRSGRQLMRRNTGKGDGARYCGCDVIDAITLAGSEFIKRGTSACATYCLPTID